MPALGNSHSSRVLVGGQPRQSGGTSNPELTTSLLVNDSDFFDFLALWVKFDDLVVVSCAVHTAVGPNRQSPSLASAMSLHHCVLLAGLFVDGEDLAATCGSQILAVEVV